MPWLGSHNLQKPQVATNKPAKGPIPDAHSTASQQTTSQCTKQDRDKSAALHQALPPTSSFAHVAAGWHTLPARTASSASQGERERYSTLRLCRKNPDAATPMISISSIFNQSRQHRFVVLICQLPEVPRTGKRHNKYPCRQIGQQFRAITVQFAA